VRLSETRLRESFPDFSRMVWAYLGLPPPDWLQTDIAEYLQHGPRRRFICGLRGIGKSYLTCAYVVWRAWNRSDLITVVRSGAAEKAKDNVKLIKGIITSIPILAPLVPKSNEGMDNDLKQEDGAFRFDWGTKRFATKDPSVAAYGIGGTSVGSHPDLHIDDDIETPTNALTVPARKKLRTLAIEREKMLRDKENGEIVVLGTFQTLDSIYKEDLQFFDTRFYPAWYPKAGTLPHKHLAPVLMERLREDPSLEDTPTLPERFPEADLLLDEAQDKAGHACHMRLNPDLGDQERHPLKCRNLSVMTVNPGIGPMTVLWGREKTVPIKCPGFGDDCFHSPSHVSDQYAPYQGSVIVVDPSGKGKDETAWAAGFHLNGNIYCPAVNGRQDGHSDKTLEAIVEDAKRLEIRTIIVEPNYGGGMFTSLLQSKALAMGWQCSVTDGTWASGQKELRIIGALEPALNLHRVIIDHSVAQDTRLMYQLTHITRDRGSLEHDDRIEAFADMVRHFSDLVVLDQKKRLKEAQEAEVRAMSRQLERDVSSPKAGRWVVKSAMPKNPKKVIRWC
jgi:hypothetical protein